MQKIIRYTVLVLVLAAFVGGISSCDPPSTPISPEQQTLVDNMKSGEWTFDSFSSGTPSAQLRSTYQGMRATFKVNGNRPSRVTFLTSAAARMAVPRLPDSKESQWLYTGIRDRFIISSDSLFMPSSVDGSSLPITVAEATATTLRYSAKVQGSGEVEFQWKK